MKKIVCITLLLFTRISAMDADYLSDYARAQISHGTFLRGMADLCGTERGCIKCDNYSCCLDERSREGLCEQCEFEKYPQRFVACLFCRRPLKQSFDIKPRCLDCSANVSHALIVALLMTENWHDRDNLSMGISSFLDHTKKFRKSIKAFIDTTTRDRALKNFNYNQNPRFYRGCKKLENGNLLHVWSQELHIDPSDKKTVSNWDEAETYVRSIWEKYNLFGPETGAITLEPIPANCLTYEEVVQSPILITNN